MAAEPVPLHPATRRHARNVERLQSIGIRRPIRIEVDRHELVGDLLDYQALTREAMFANGAALQLLISGPRDAASDEAIRATHDTHNALVRLLAVLRASAGHYDGRDNA